LPARRGPGRKAKACADCLYAASLKRSRERMKARYVPKAQRAPGAGKYRGRGEQHEQG